jgi:hypothetical protein
LYNLFGMKIDGQSVLQQLLLTAEAGEDVLFLLLSVLRVVDGVRSLLQDLLEAGIA